MIFVWKGLKINIYTTEREAAEINKIIYVSPLDDIFLKKTIIKANKKILILSNIKKKAPQILLYLNSSNKI